MEVEMERMDMFEEREAARKAEAIRRRDLRLGTTVERAERVWDLSDPDCRGAYELLLEDARRAWRTVPEFRIQPTPRTPQEAEWLLRTEPTVVTGRPGGLAHSFLGAEIVAEDDAQFDPFWYARPVDEGAVDVKVRSDAPYRIDRTLPSDELSRWEEDERVGRMYARQGEFPEAGQCLITRPDGTTKVVDPRESSVTAGSTLSRDVPNPHTIPEGSFTETLFSESILEATAWVALGAYQTTTKSGHPAIRLGTMMVATTNKGHVRAECGKCGKTAVYTDATARERMVKAWYDTLASLDPDDEQRGALALEAAYEARHAYQGAFTAYFIKHGYECQYEAQKARPSGYARTVSPEGEVTFHVTDRVYVGLEPQPSEPGFHEAASITYRPRPAVGSEWARITSTPDRGNPVPAQVTVAHAPVDGWDD